MDLPHLSDPTLAPHVASKALLCWEKDVLMHVDTSKPNIQSTQTQLPNAHGPNQLGFRIYRPVVCLVCHQATGQRRQNQKQTCEGDELPKMAASFPQQLAEWSLAGREKVLKNLEC